MTTQQTLQPLQLRTAQRVALSFCGALVLGSLWRIRGDGGFGATWGMLAVAAVFWLFLFSLFGERQKMQYSFLPIAVGLTCITAGGWGTLVSQMGGILGSTAAFTGETAVRIVAVSPWSGMAIMLLLGFGWMPFFAFLLGMYTSERTYKLREVALAVALYYAVLYLCSATVSHQLLQWICPPAVELFADGIQDAGLAGTPYEVFMQHFSNTTWAKQIPGGRNYFQSVYVISTAVATLALGVYTRFLLKDKLAARVHLGVSGIVAVSITAANLAMSMGNEGGILYLPRLQQFFNSFGSWSLWEYGTGFLAGLGITALLLHLHKKHPTRGADVPQAFPTLGKGARYAYQVVFTLFGVLCLSWIRPLATRIDKSEGTLFVCVLVGLILVFLLVCALLARKSILQKDLQTPSAQPFRTFCTKTFLLLYFLMNLIYFFVSTSPYLFVWPWSRMTLLMLASFAGACILYFTVRKPLEEV